MKSGRTRINECSSSPSDEDAHEEIIIDQFNTKINLRDDLENTKQTLMIMESEKKDYETISSTDGENVVVLRIQDRLFYTTRNTLIGGAEMRNVELSKFMESISNNGRTENEIQFALRKELAKETALFTHCDPDKLEYVQAGENLFKSMQEQLKIYDGTEESINTHFQDRDATGFEYVLDHLRLGGRVKCLGIEKFKLDLLTCIQKESTYFKTEKLTQHIQILIRTNHRSEVLNCEIDRMMNTNSNNTPISQVLHEATNQIGVQQDKIEKLSKEIAENFKLFIAEDMSREDAACANLAIKLNVSGQKFKIPFRVLAQFDHFIITRYIQSPNFKVGSDEHIFIDRNPDLFSLIYSYMMCSGKFNHFPSYMSTEKKLQLKTEADFYGLNTLVKEYSDDLRYPIELLSLENIKLKERDDWLRKYFVQQRDSPILDDLYLNLSPIFENIDEIRSAERFKIDFVKCPKLLDLTNKLQFSRHVAKPRLVNSLDTFKKNWFDFTQGLLEGLEWNGIFVGGGSVLGCLLKEDEPIEHNSLVTEFLPNLSKGYEYGNPANRTDLNMDEDGFNYWKPSSERNEMTNIEKYNNRFTIVSSGYRCKEYYKKPWQGRKYSENASRYTDHNQTRFIPGANIPSSFKKSDIDLFLYAMSDEEAESKIKHIYRTIKDNLKKRSICEVTNSNLISQPTEVVDDDIIVLRTNYAVTFYAYKARPIQVVLRVYKSPAEILLSFDIDAASVGFDGTTVWSTDRCRRSLAHHVNLIDVDRQSTTYEYRLYKYAKRGFAVGVPGYHHSKVKNDLLKRPRIGIFSKIQKNYHGLARLLLFHFSCTSKNPRHILGCYDDPNSTNAHMAEGKWANHQYFISGQETKPSDYMSVSIINTNKYQPKDIYEYVQNCQEKVKTFVCTFNDIDTNLRNEQELLESVPKYVKFITVDPGSQIPIGSFHPRSDNFFKSAYSKFNQEDLGDSSTIVWYRSIFDHPVDNVQYIKHGGYPGNWKREAYFKAFDSHISFNIEQAFRNFLFYGNNTEYCIDENELIDFQSWSLRYGTFHPIYPNQTSYLFREIDFEEDEISEPSQKFKRLSPYSYY